MGKKYWKLLLRLAGIVVGTLLVLAGLIWGLIHIPYVQQRLARSLTDYISQKTHTRIEVGKVHIDFFHTLTLNQIYLEDQQADTLTYIGQLKVRLNMLDIFRQKLFLDEICITQAKIRLSEKDSTYNFQFLIDAFSSPDSSVVDTSIQTPWQLGLSTINLQQVNVSLQTSDYAEEVSLGNATLVLDLLDLEKKQVQIQEITLKEGAFSHILWGSAASPPPTTDSLTFPQSGWRIGTTNIDLENIAIRYEDNTVPTLTSGIDYHHLHLRNLSLSLRQLHIDDSLIKVAINGATFKEKSGFSLVKLNANLKWSPHAFILEGLKLETPGSQMMNDTKLSYPSLNDLAALNKDLRIQSRFSNTEIDVREIEFFVPAIADFLKPHMDQKLRFSGSLEGTPALLQGKKWSVISSDWLSLAASFELSRLTEPDSMYLDLQLDHLKVETARLKQVLKTPLPAAVATLGKVQYQGDYQGGIYGGQLRGHLSSSIGKLTHQGYARFNSDYSDATYALDISLDELDLGALTNNDSLGKFSLLAKLSGSGLTWDNLSTRVDATIKEANLVGYAYNDVAIHGQITRRAFSGEIDIQDEHLALNFAGDVNFNDSIPQFHFQAQLDTLNLDKIHLSDQPFGMKANFIADLQGNQANQLEGTAHITGLSLSGSGKHYAEDSIKFIAKNLPDTRQQIHLNSDLINVNLSGNYQIAALPGQLVHFVENYFPLLIAKPDSLVAESFASMPDQDFQLSIHLNNPQHLSRLFVPKLTQLDTLSLEIAFDSKKELLDGQIFIPELTYDGMRTDSIMFEVHTKDSSILADFSVANFRTSSSPEGKDVFTNIRIQDQHMDVDLRIANDSIKRLLEMHTWVRPENGGYFLQMKPGFFLNDQEWKVNPENSSRLGASDIEISQLELQQGRQQLAINGNTKDSLDIRFNFFELAEISNLLSIEAYHLQGQINGAGHVMNLNSQNPYYKAAISISGVSLNEDPIGDLSISILTNAESDMATIKAGMTGKSRLDISGTYDILQTDLAVGIDIQGLQLALVKPFVDTYLSHISGMMTGKLSVKGKPSNPQIMGDIGFEQAAAQVNDLKTYYTFPKERISIQPTKIYFDQFAVIDTLGRKALLTGEVSHQNFKDIRFNLGFTSNEFLFLNTKAGDNKLYYGKMLLELSTAIKGNPANIRITGNAKTLPGTNLTVFTSDESDVVVQEDYVLFVSPQDFDQAPIRDSARIGKQSAQANVDGFTLDLNLEITPDAQLTYVLDSLSGEKIQVSGTGNLTLGINPSGDISLRGIYEVTKGNYHFSYESLINKDFEIRAGSTIIFSGDPIDARLAITANYTARTTTYELISNELTDPGSQLAKDAKKRTDVIVVLQLDGAMMKPDLSFDIQVPNENAGFSSTVTDAVSRKLVQIRQDESELNQQVMGLLLFGGFIQKGSLLTGGTSLGSIAASSISGFLTNQLNQLSEKYIQGVQVNVNLESYQSKGGTSNTVSQLDIGVSRQLMNDRLTVSFDTGIGLETSSYSQVTGTSLTQITGSFVITYNLTEDGRYTLQVFRKSDAEDPVNSANNTSVKTGVGATYRKTFD